MWRLNIAAYFYFPIVLLCKLSQRNDGADSNESFESENAVPEDYDDADCGITLARLILTFFRPRRALGN
jgi:hypothetical protein